MKTCQVEVVNNTANSNVNSGIYLDSSSNNTIYNNLFNNTNNARDDDSNNWNTTLTAGTNIIGGSYLGGNIWAYPNGTGFSETCTDADSDGICDSSYTIASGNVDYLPLTANPDTTPPTITITSPTNTTYTTSSVDLNVSANETIDTWWYSLDGGANTTFTPNTTLSGLSNGQHNVIVYANDSAGNVGVGEIEVVIKSWGRTYDGGSSDFAGGVAVDGSGNVYVTGCYSPLTGEGCDYYTIKYDSSGSEIWNATYDGGDIEHANGVAVDSSGNVYVTGASYLSGNDDYYTIKYDSSGSEVWNATYDSGSNDSAYGIAVDGSGNVYVTGDSGGDYYTIKYNSSGDVVWNRTYDSGNDDEANGVAVDSSGNVYVTGGSYTGGNEDDYYTIKYDSSGSEIWNATYDGGSGDIGLAVAADDSGNVYVTGSSTLTSDGDYYTIKYDENGTELWNATYNGGGVDHGNGVAVDGSGNVYVTGHSYLGGNKDYYTIKYDSSGSEVWNRIYDGGGTDDAFGVAVDGSGNVYVTGESYLGSNEDYYTIKYSEVTGPVYFTVSVATTSSGGGGGGGGGAPPAKDKETEGTTVTPTEADVVVQVDATFSSIPKDKTGTISIPETEDMPLTEIAIKVKSKVSNVKVAVKVITSKPIEITREIAGEVLRYLKIDHENIKNDDIDKVTIKFKVEKTWIAKNNIDTVVLNRFSEGQWNALTTTKDSEDEQYGYYSAESPGLSVFGISGQVQTVTTTTLPVTTTVPTTVAPTTAPPAAPTTTAPPAEEAKSPVGKIILALVVIVIIAGAAYYFYQKKGTGA